MPKKKKEKKKMYKVWKITLLREEDMIEEEVYGEERTKGGGLQKLKDWKLRVNVEKTCYIRVKYLRYNVDVRNVTINFFNEDTITQSMLLISKLAELKWGVTNKIGNLYTFIELIDERYRKNTRLKIHDYQLFFIRGDEHIQESVEYYPIKLDTLTPIKILFWLFYVNKFGRLKLRYKLRSPHTLRKFNKWNKVGFNLLMDEWILVTNGSYWKEDNGIVTFIKSNKRCREAAYKDLILMNPKKRRIEVKKAKMTIEQYLQGNSDKYFKIADILKNEAIAGNNGQKNYQIRKLVRDGLIEKIGKKRNYKIRWLKKSS